MLGHEPSGPLPVQAPLTSHRSPTTRTTARLLVAGLLFGGCAASADVAGLATQDELLRLRADVASLQRSVQQTRARTETLSTEVASRSREPAPVDDRQVQAITQRLDGLAASLTSLTKRIDDLTTRVDTLGRQVRSGPPVRPTPTPSPTTASPAPSPPSSPAPPPLGASVSSTATPTTAAPATATPGAPSPPPAPATPTPAPARSTTGVLQPQDLYQASYIDFSKGSYVLAIDGFREFLRRYPDHPQANAAQYWIGEGYVALGQQSANAGQRERAAESLQRAVQEFRKVVANYPRGDRAPTALYKEALTLIELKQPAVAQARLQYLVDNFPQAEETPLARERLAALRQR